MFNKIKTAFQKCKNVVLGALGLLGAASVAPTSSHAAGVADLFTAVDTTTLSTNVSTILVSLIGVSLLFLAGRYIKKAIS